MPPLFTKGELKAKSLLPHLFRQNATPFYKRGIKSKVITAAFIQAKCHPFLKKGN